MDLVFLFPQINIQKWNSWVATWVLSSEVTVTGQLAWINWLHLMNRNHEAFFFDFLRGKGFCCPFPASLPSNAPKIYSCTALWFLNMRHFAAETPTPWPPDVDSWLTGKETWCWERLKAEGEESDRGWGGWMASPVQWTWTWANSERWWGTRKPGVLQSIGLQRVGHDLATEQQQELENWLGQRRPV